jgi:hypothetical protein
MVLCGGSGYRQYSQLISGVSHCPYLHKEADMTGYIAMEWSGLGYVICAVLYLVFIHLLDKLEKAHSLKKPVSDEESLTRISKILNCSEYELFKMSTQDWSLSMSRVESDFKDYLTKGFLPYYVRSFIRKHSDLLKHPKCVGYTGGSLPSSWAA